MFHAPFASAVLLVLVALPASAQTTYSTSRDTLRFRETTQLRVTMTTPQGEMPMTMEHRATVALVRTAGDSVQAWFDSLSLLANGPQGEQRPATDSALKQPIRLRLDARGRVSDVVPPKWPANLQGLSDPAHHFDDYFLRMPAQPLKVGLAWSDTTTQTDSTADRFARWIRRTDYRVERDTTVGTTPALVVRAKQNLSVMVSGPVPNQAMRSDAQLTGETDGFFVFSPKTGRLIGRRSEGKMEGPVKVSGAMGDMQMSQSIAITSAVDAVQ